MEPRAAARRGTVSDRIRAFNNQQPQQGEGVAANEDGFSHDRGQGGNPATPEARPDNIEARGSADNGRRRPRHDYKPFNLGMWH